MKASFALVALIAAVAFASPIQHGSESVKPRALFIVHRHGERTLAATFGGDPLNNATIWPDGLSQLTIEGRSRMFRLGQFFKRHYESTIGINPKNVYVRSSGIDRCLESAQMVVHPMYPPAERWNWRPSETWQPIPIYTIHKPKDGMLNPGAFCPAAKEEEHFIMTQERAQFYQHKFAPLLKKITENVNFEVNDLFTAKAVYDSISTALVNEKPVPKWVDDLIFKDLKTLYDATFELEFSTRRQQRFRTGVLFNEIKERLDSLVSPPPAKEDWIGIRWDDVNDRHKNVFVYSTHDSMVAALLSALRVYDNVAPPFGASIVFEVFGPEVETESVAGETQIRIGYLKFSDSQEIEYMKVPGCDQTVDNKPSCTLAQFYEIIDDLHMPLDQWNRECLQL